MAELSSARLATRRDRGSVCELVFDESNTWTTRNRTARHEQLFRTAVGDMLTDDAQTLERLAFADDVVALGVGNLGA